MRCCRVPRRARVLAGPVTLVVLGFATVTGFHYVDPRYLAVNVGTPPPVPDVSEMCDLRDPLHRAFWSTGHVRHCSLMHERIRSIGGYEQSLLPRRLAHLQKKLGIGNGMVLPFWARSLAEHTALASRYSLRCVLTGPTPVLEAGGFIAQPKSPAHDAQVYVNPDARPRVRLEHQVRRAASPEEALALIGVAPATGVVLEEAAADDVAATPCATADDDRAELVHDAPEEVRVRTRSDCASYLVLTDTYVPGWSATVDGAPAPILPADYAFRAVRSAPASTRSSSCTVLRAWRPGSCSRCSASSSPRCSSSVRDAPRRALAARAARVYGARMTPEQIVRSFCDGRRAARREGARRLLHRRRRLSQHSGRTGDRTRRRSRLRSGSSSPPATSVEFEMLAIASSGNVVLTERIDRFVLGGKSIAIPVMGTFELTTDGKIKAWRDYFDMQQFMSQMG